MHLWACYPQYCNWLKLQRKSVHAVRADRSRVHLFLTWLLRNKKNYPDLSIEKARDAAIAEYLDHLQYSLRARPSTLTKTISSINHFYSYAGLGAARVERDDMPSPEMMALSAEEQEQFLKATRMTSAKQRAVAMLLFHTGMKLADCSALNLQDLNLTESTLTIPDRNGELGRIYKLNGDTTTALYDWMTLRTRKYHRATEDALFVNPQRRRITPAGLNLIVRKIGDLVKLEISAQTLRETHLMRRFNEDGNERISSLPPQAGAEAQPALI